MFFHIKEIVLWPKKSGLPPRTLSFQPGRVNVITGASRTGKSAVIPVIDYCLGSEKCRIPVKTVRDACEWFGVVVQTPSGEKLFARREPGLQKATGDMFVVEASSVDIPETIEAKNTTVDAVKRTLDQLAELTELDFGSDGNHSGFHARPSFRDLDAFTFQPQNVVANPEVLFYKTESYEHREKLRTIFPYVLHAITPELMAKQHQLAELRKELRRKQSELDTVRQVSQTWMAQIRASASEAKELGLIQQDIPQDATRERLVDLLSRVVHGATDEIKVSADTISDAVDELMALQKEESEVSMELSRLRRRLSDMSALRQSTAQYRDSLQLQMERLQAAQWLRELHDRDHLCPLCGNSATVAAQNIEDLYNALKAIEEEAGQFGTAVPAAFDREFERVRTDITVFAEKLRGIGMRRQALERRSGEAKERQYESLKTSRFIGNLEQSLQTYQRIGEDGELSNEVLELRERVASLDKEISAAGVAARTKRALEAVNANAEKLLPHLDCERPDDPIFLSADDLTIRVGSINREDYLWEIGSGSNWLSYHIAVTLGLHRFFLSLPHSPVPSFIVYDQPSQVYFPKKLAVRDDEQENPDPQYKDDDIEAVRKVFQVFSSMTEMSQGKLQIIVLDHAAENVWGRISNVHMVEEWRNGNKLVPLNWLEES